MNALHIAAIAAFIACVACIVGLNQELHKLELRIVRLEVKVACLENKMEK